MVSRSRTGTQGIDETQRQFLNWIGWKVLLPLILLVLIWPLYGSMLHLPHSFIRAFAPGDLLIFSSLILMEAAIEGEHLPHQSFASLLARMLAKIFAIVFIASYVAIRYSVVLHENGLLKELAAIPQLNPAQVEKLSEMSLNNMLPYSCFSCVVAIVSVIFSVLAFWKNVRFEQTVTIKRLQQESDQPQPEGTG
jgi:uncharacterized membrane protein